MYQICIILLSNISIWNYCPSHGLVKTNFWQYFCYISLNQTQTHLNHWKVLDELWGEISSESHNSKSERFHHGGLWDIFFIFCQIRFKFNPRVRLNLGWARGYKNIAENPFSLGHGTDSSVFLWSIP